MISGETRLGEHDPSGPRFWIAAAVGLGIVAFGVRGLLSSNIVGSAQSWASFLIGGLILHDGLLAPVVIGVSVATVFLVGSRVRPVVQGTLYVVACAVAISIPVLTGQGRNPGNPSILPRDYWRDLAIVVGVIALCGAALALRRLRRPAPPEPAADPGGW